MRLRRLELHNYRQHTSLAQDLDGHIIGLRGANGSGKSNFLNAIQFAMAGKVPGVPKSNMLTWGKDRGNVCLTLDHQGATYTIRRNLHNASASLDVVTGDESVSVSGSTAVSRELEARIGITSDLCRQAIFVRQTEVDAILFQDPAVRARAWLRLCGLGSAEKTHTLMGALLGRLPDLTDWQPLREQAEAHRDVTAAELDRVQRELHTATADPPQRPTVSANHWAECARAAKSAQEAQAQADALGDIRVRRDECRAIVDSWDAAGTAQGLQQGSDAIATLQEQQEQAQENIRAAGLAARQRTARENATARVQEYAAEHGDPIQLADAASRAQRDFVTWTEELAAANKDHVDIGKLEAIAVSGDDCTCPLCASPLSDGEFLRKHIAGLRERNDARRSEAQQSRSTFQGQMARYLELQQESQRRSTYLDFLTAPEETESAEALEAVLVTITGRLAEWQAHADKLTDTKRSMDAKVQMVATLQAQLDVADRRATETAAQSEQLWRQVGAEAHPPFGQRVAWATDQQQLVTAAETAYQIYAAQLAAATRAVATAQDAHDKAVAGAAKICTAQTEQADYEQAMVELRAARDWFHPSKGPRSVIATMLDQVTGAVNELLEALDTGFRVDSDYENLSYRFYYVDARDVGSIHPPVTELSGGEKVALAIAFRFACYCMFADSTGLLTLDEPTAYLDTKHIAQFAALLDRVKSMAVQLDLQVLLATHRELITEAMDMSVEFALKTGEVLDTP